MIPACAACASCADVAPLAARPDTLDETAHALSDQLQARLTALGHLPLPFYPSFEDYDDPASGFAIGEAPVRFSQAYAGARSRLGILVETHSWRPYKQRVASTYHMLQALFERAAQDAPAWARAAREADAADQALRAPRDALCIQAPHRVPRLRLRQAISLHARGLAMQVVAFDADEFMVVEHQAVDVARTIGQHVDAMTVRAARSHHRNLDVVD